MKRPRGAGAGARAAPAVEILVESARWRTRRGVRPLLRRAITEAAATLSTMAQSTRPAGLAIVLTNDSAIRKLNRTWRAKDQPTNVLAFPAPRPASPQGSLGDI